MGPLENTQQFMNTLSQSEELTTPSEKGYSSKDTIASAADLSAGNYASSEPVMIPHKQGNWREFQEEIRPNSAPQMGWAALRLSEEDLLGTRPGKRPTPST